MPTVPEFLVNLYQWITYLSPIWWLLILIFWTPIKNLYNRLIKKPTKDNITRLDIIDKKLVQIDKDIKERKEVSKALLHHEILQASLTAIRNGYISEYELENLDELYTPYKQLGGNGTAEKLYNDVKNLPIK